jgi:hypothetical protein
MFRFVSHRLMLQPPRDFHNLRDTPLHISAVFLIISGTLKPPQCRQAAPEERAALCLRCFAAGTPINILGTEMFPLASLR